MIARRALEVNRGDYFELVTSKRMKLTQHDCYKGVTQRIQEKCFDLPVSDERLRRRFSESLFSRTNTF